MGAQQSNAANGTVSDVAKNYGTLIDTMMTNQIGFASSLKDISDVEREWFSSFEAYLSDTKSNISSEDSLYRNIQAFMRLSGDDTKALLDQISDSTLRASAESVLTRTNKAIVLQKYYEYKYLHLSAVFMNFTEFVQKLFELTANASVQVATNQAELTTQDVTELLDAMTKVLPREDSENLKRSVQAVHKSSHDRLRQMSQQLDKIIQVSREHMSEFPVRQLQQQQAEGQVQLREAVSSTPRPTPSPTPTPTPMRPTIPSSSFGIPSAPIPDTGPGMSPGMSPGIGPGVSRPSFNNNASPIQGPSPSPIVQTQRQQSDPSPFALPTGPVPANDESDSDGSASETESESTTASGSVAGRRMGDSSFANPSTSTPDSPSPSPSRTGFGFDSPMSTRNDDVDPDRPNANSGEPKKLPDDAFLFGGGGFLAKATRDINKIVKGGGVVPRRRK